MTSQELTVLPVSDADETTFGVAIAELNRLTGALAVAEDTRQRAATLYRDASEHDLLRGRTLEGVVTACLYIACRKHHKPRSLDEFDRVADVDRTEIARTYRAIVSELDIQMQPVDASQFVDRFCSTLGTSGELAHRATEILAESKREGIHSGRSPTALAGGAIYIAGMLCDEHLTQEEIADVAAVAIITIRTQYQSQLAVVDCLDTSTARL